MLLLLKHYNIHAVCDQIFFEKLQLARVYLLDFLFRKHTYILLCRISNSYFEQVSFKKFHYMALLI